MLPYLGFSFPIVIQPQFSLSEYFSCYEFNALSFYFIVSGLANDSMQCSKGRNTGVLFL
jgi:hypothetical protein